MLQIGTYDLEVCLDDGYSQKNKYKVRLNVQDPNKNKGGEGNFTEDKKQGGTNYNVELIQASFKILEVTRDGKCRVKIVASKASNQLTNFIRLETFKIVVLTKKN